MTEASPPLHAAFLEEVSDVIDYEQPHESDDTATTRAIGDIALLAEHHTYPNDESGNEDLEPDDNLPEHGKLTVAQIGIRDQALLDRFRGGDIEAFGELYRHHHRRVLYSVISRGATAATADDVVATTFEQAMIQCGRNSKLYFDVDKGAERWLLRVARNIYFSMLKNKDDRAIYDKDLESELADKPSSINVERSVVTDTMNDELWSYIDSIPPNYREVLVLRFRHDLTHREVAEFLGSTEPAIRVMQSRALSSLARKVRNHSFYDF